MCAIRAADFLQVSFKSNSRKASEPRARAYSEVKPPSSGSPAWVRMKCRSLGWLHLAVSLFTKNTAAASTAPHSGSTHLNPALRGSDRHERPFYSEIPWQRCISCKTCLTFKQGEDRSRECRRSAVLALHVKHLVKMSGSERAVHLQQNCLDWQTPFKNLIYSQVLALRMIKWDSFHCVF